MTGGGGNSPGGGCYATLASWGRKRKESRAGNNIFGYLGGVSPVIVFDNATGVGRRVGEVIHEAKLFARMRAHYGFSIRFCNPDSGHEKGNVESKIGYTRRNLFVPEPEFDDVEAYNRELLDLHSDKAEEAALQEAPAHQGTVRGRSRGPAELAADAVRRRAL